MVAPHPATEPVVLTQKGLDYVEAQMPVLYADCGARNSTVLYADAGLRRHVMTVFREMAEGEIVSVQTGWATEDRRVTWGIAAPQTLAAE